MVAYTNWVVGDIVRFCITVEDFCSTTGNYIDLGNFDIQKSGTPLTCDVGTYDCINTSDRRVRIKSMKTYSPSDKDVRCSNLSGTIYRELGDALSDSDGIATIEHVVTEQDRTDYLDAISTTGGYYDIAFCLDDSLADIQHAKVQYSVTITAAPPDLCAGVTCLEPLCLDGKLYDAKCDPTTGLCIADTTKLIADPCPSNYFDLVVSPWSWYDPNSAAQAMILKLNNINGAIINFFAEYGIIDYTYTAARIFPKGDKVMVRIYVNKTGLSSMAAQLTVGQIVLIIVIIGLIIIAIGRIVDWFWGETDQGLSNDQLTGAGEQLMGDTVDGIQDACEDDTTLTQDQKVNCITDQTVGALGNWGDYQDGIYPDANHDPLDTGKTKVQQCKDTYDASPKSTTDYDTFKNCVKTEAKKAIKEDKDNTLKVYPGGSPAGSKQIPGCLIENPLGGCLLTKKTAKTVAIVGGLLIGAKIVYDNFIKK